MARGTMQTINGAQAVAPGSAKRTGARIWRAANWAARWLFVYPLAVVGLVVVLTWPGRHERFEVAQDVACLRPATRPATAPARVLRHDPVQGAASAQ